jgi:predicted transposase/invertase (TIGR01784 family)
VIADLEIINPYQAPRIRGVKDTYLDVKAHLASGQTVIIEMQVLNVEGFEKRILYNAAKAYSIQLAQGEQYALLNPVIALTITDFTMFSEFEAVISRFVLKEKHYLVDYPTCDLELVFVELPKFKLGLEQLTSLTEKWMYFLQNTRQLESIPATMGEVPEIQQAFEVANQANLSPDELEELEHQLIFIQDQLNAIALAEKRSLEQGIKQGMEQGIKQGIEQGIKQGIEQGIKQGIEQAIEQGIEQTQRAIAEKLLPTMTNEEISQVTGLSGEQVQSLRPSGGQFQV